MTNNHESRTPSDRPSTSTAGSTTDPRITLRSPAELADALPYMLGFHPTDSLVMVAVHGEGGRFGGRLRVGIPATPAEWEDTARQVADCLIRGSERREGKPDGIVVFLCQEPLGGESGQRVMTRLRPLAQRIRLACGALDVPVLEALCLSAGRFWSYVCPDERCCPAEGSRLAAVGTSVMAAAATFAGLQVRGSLKEIEGRLAPLGGAVAAEMEGALDRAAAALVPKILDGATREEVGAETLELARSLMRRMALAPPVEGAQADDRDDALLGHDEAAALILGLQDREIRDIAAEWMEDEEAGPALRLWRALARRCVGAYGEHAAAPLTLAGWVSWSTGDEPTARIALGLALRADSDYRFAQLLHHACNEGIDPEGLRECLREERRSREPRRGRRPAGSRPPGRRGKPAPSREPRRTAGSGQ
ncbi:DUF4192 domain-containing protein [Streptomyces sp. NBC_00047]|uniref:DUF4192 domain-containing protein n=1 Tax=unclassified Streptomyces TaxID=2593676 RepID=UPI00214C0B89|nr:MULTISPECIES: DUF4192 domain-containing protein [unclassified Streptomyces]MCX5611786.1 DUF4192 domain-containing protein [Streptomyces sp. NBC_00047]UUU39606.1 DUF4192 domain-containing protein [Streptomyces sp. NBC_00162]